MDDGAFKISLLLQLENVARQDLPLQMVYHVPSYHRIVFVACELTQSFAVLSQGLQTFFTVDRDISTIG